MISPSFLVALARLLPIASEKLDEFKGKPSKADKKRLQEFVSLLDERRVFYASYNIEVVECVIGSLRDVVGEAAKTIAALTHPPAKAGVGLILDDGRRYLDKWGTYRTPRSDHHGLDRFERHRLDRDRLDHDGRRKAVDQAELDKLIRFFTDLGGLRAQVVGAIVFLRECCDPKLTARNLLPDEAVDDEP